MRLEVNSSFERSFICDIEENGGIMRWQYERNSRPEHVLIIRAPYEARVSLSEIVSLINSNPEEIVEDKVLALTPDINCKLVRSIQGRGGVYKVTYAPALYAVFGCVYEGEALAVYDQESARQNICRVSAVVEYHVEDVPITVTSGGLFHKKKIQYNFSKITVKQSDSYIDGALFYTFEGSPNRYNISKSMLGTPIFVRWFNNERNPILRSDLEGYRVEKR